MTLSKGSITLHKVTSLVKIWMLTFRLCDKTAESYPPMRMLLIGMNTIFTANPMNPMAANPTPVAKAIFFNSAISKRDEVHPGKNHQE